MTTLAKLTTLILVLLLSLNGLAAGIFTLRGKLKAMTEDAFVIETKAVIYRIRKSSLGEAEVREIQKRRTGDTIDLVVSSDAVMSVSDRK